MEIKNKIFLAPMAGYTDQAFRIISFRQGADIAYSEMVSAKAMMYKDKKTYKLLEVSKEEKCVGLQLFGSSPEILGKATEVLDKDEKISIIDLNIGCPAPKIYKNEEGSALLKNPSLINKILLEMRKKTDKPLSAKMRLGVDEKSNYLEIAKSIEEAGVDFFIVHGRTRDQYYSGEADWEAIGKIKLQSSIPVIGNGDINFSTDIKKLIADYKVDGLMVGRGAIGNPWIFQKIKGELAGQTYLSPNTSEKFNLIIDHLNLICQIKGEKLGVTEMRKHLHSYLKGMKESAKLKNKINSIKEKDELSKILYSYRDDLLTSIE